MLHACSSQPCQEHSVWPAASCSIPPSHLHSPPLRRLQTASSSSSSSLGNVGCGQGHTARLWHYECDRGKSGMRYQPGLGFSGSLSRETACPWLSKVAGTAQALWEMSHWGFVFKQGRMREEEKDLVHAGQTIPGMLGRCMGCPWSPLELTASISPLKTLLMTVLSMGAAQFDAAIREARGREDG